MTAKPGENHAVQHGTTVTPWVLVCPLDRADMKGEKNSPREAFAVLRSCLTTRLARGEPSLDVMGGRRVALSFGEQTRSRAGAFEGVLLYGASPYDQQKTIVILQELALALIHGLEQDAVEINCGAQQLMCVRGSTAAAKLVLH